MKSVLFLVFSVIILLGCNKDEKRTELENLLIDEWLLVSFVNELDGTSINEDDVDHSNPISNDTGSITIDFKENFSYTGNTGRNEFLGNYTLNNSETVLIFLTYGSTEVNESDWSRLFLKSLNLNYNSQTQNYENVFEVSTDILKIYYSDNEFMKFKRL